MVEGGGSVHDLPLYVVGLALLLQLPNIGAQSGAALSLSLFWKSSLCWYHLFLKVPPVRPV